MSTATEVTAKLEFDPARTDRAVVEAVAEAAGPEIDNVALRAELARQLDQINQSRARLATAHLDERRRLERDLHDGAQQRLLAIALQLQSARVNGSQPALIDEVDRAIADLGHTVHDLRDLEDSIGVLLLERSEKLWLGIDPSAAARASACAARSRRATRAVLPLWRRFSVVSVAVNGEQSDA